MSETRTMKLKAIAETAGYFPFIRGPHRREVSKRSRYWREYSRRRYHSDPTYRARKLEAAILARLRGEQTIRFAAESKEPPR